MLVRVMKLLRHLHQNPVNVLPKWRALPSNGGKKLYDYMQTKNAVKEEATSGATVSSNIGVVVNPVAAHAKIKRDKNGVPKAPQAKNPDGTAKSALDIKNNLMGGKTIKR